MFKHIFSSLYFQTHLVCAHFMQIGTRVFDFEIREKKKKTNEGIRGSNAGYVMVEGSQQQ